MSLSQRAILPTDGDVDAAVGALKAYLVSVKAFPIPSDASRWRWLATAARAFFRDCYDVAWLRSPAVHRHLALMASRQSFDLVHLDTIGLWPYAMHFPSTPVVLNHHNVESQMMTRRATNERRRLKRLYFARQAKKLARLERDVCRQVATNLVVSALDGQRLRVSAPGSPIHIVDNGVDVQFFHPTADMVRDPFALVFAGRMSWYPNRQAVEYLLGSIWPALRARDPRYRITIVGKAPPAHLQALRDDAVRITGFVQDVRAYIDEAAIYVCPILDGGGTRLKVLDALAMAKPLVATGLAVEGLDLVDGEHYLRAETPGAFVDQITRLHRDPDLASRLGERGRELVVSRYSWEVIGEKLAQAYQAAVRIQNRGRA